MKKVFIDGSAGTTGLRIYDRLKVRDDIQLKILPEQFRKDENARKDYLNNSDIAILCLPDAASIEAISFIENDNVKIIDTSTAHRVSSGWIYGFPELIGLDVIANANRIANPGCHASGFISLIYPLIKNNIISKEIKLNCYSITGYTGGGKKMIAEYEGDKPLLYNAPRMYGLNQMHKHLPEMKNICGLENEPFFCPIVSDFPCGMEVSVGLFKSDYNANIAQLKDCYKSFYTGKMVRYVEDSENNFLSASAYAGKDSMGISVYGNEDRILLVSRFDNLGKGASGSALQNLNIMLGCEEDKGLIL